MKHSKFIDLFAGCGGLSLGLENAGFEVVFFNEIVPTFAATYLANHQLEAGNYYIGDINGLNANIETYRDIILNPEKPITLVCGGPPCQGFSMANRQRIIDDPRNQLYKAYLQFLSYTRPQFFIMENVKGMASKIDEIKDNFIEYLGDEYLFDYRLLNAKDFGVPQNRERFIMIGNRIGIKPGMIFNQIDCFRREPFVLRDALEGLPCLQSRKMKNQGELESEESGYTERNFEYPDTSFYHFINGDRVVKKLYNHKNRYNNPRDIEIYRRLPQGANSLHESIRDIMPYSNRNHMFKDKYFKLDETQVCKTITSHMRYDCNMYIHPREARGLSPREAARIQTFPDDFVFCGAQNSWYAQIGNAVPVKLAEAIGRGNNEVCEMIIRRTLQHIELFAGIGGFRTAMDILGRDKIARFKHVGYSEIDRKAVQTYCANYDTENEVVMGDIVHFTESVERIGKLPNFDLLTGGFPCQTFSMMGHQRGFDDERGLMFFRIMDIVRVKHPPYILLENVKNLYTHDKRRTFTRIVEELKAAGYNVVYDIFNTQDFCLPQTRNRVLIFATLEPLPNNFIFSSKAVKECFEFNKSRMSVRQSDTVIGILEKNVPDKYMLSERIKPTLLADGSAGFKSKSEINQLIARPLTASMHKMHRACQDNYYSLDFIASDGAVNQAINLSKDEQARLPIRKLTPKEAMLLQGFPEDFAAKASAMGVADGALYKQAGNAVSVNTIYAVLFYLITNKIIQ